MTGRVYQISVKPQVPGEHGIPKVRVDRVKVTNRGLEGDYNNHRQEKREGDPDQAVLIEPIETIRQLSSEGWPVGPGHIGENITTEGLPYDSFAPGNKYRIGEVIVQISKACPPCRYLHSLPYVGEEKGPEFVRTMSDRRGWYARVLQEGEIGQSDPIEMLE